MEPDRVSSQELLRDELDYLRNNAFHQVVFQMINTFLALFFFFFLTLLKTEVNTFFHSALCCGAGAGRERETTQELGAAGWAGAAFFCSCIPHHGYGSLAGRPPSAW